MSAPGYVRIHAYQYESKAEGSEPFNRTELTVVMLVAHTRSHIHRGKVHRTLFSLFIFTAVVHPNGPYESHIGSVHCSTILEILFALVQRPLMLNCCVEWYYAMENIKSRTNIIMIV